MPSAIPLRLRFLMRDRVAPKFQSRATDATNPVSLCATRSRDIFSRERQKRSTCFLMRDAMARRPNRRRLTHIYKRLKGSVKMDDERTNTMAAMHLFLTNTVFVLSAYKRRRCHRYWVQEIYRKRQEYGALYHMMLDLKLQKLLSAEEAADWNYHTLQRKSQSFLHVVK